MTYYYTVPEVADILRLPAEWDRERWVRARCKDGRIKAKQISRSVWRISEQALAEFLEPDVAADTEATAGEAAQPVSLIDGLSDRVLRGRLRDAS